MKKQEKDNLIQAFKANFIKIFTINDSPQKIAIGFGLGMTLGVLPGSGPLASLILASLLRVNKSSALIGSLLVNTWINIVTFAFAIKIGSAIMGRQWQAIYNDALSVFKNFHLRNLLDAGVFKLIIPVLLGYAIIAVLIGFSAYISAFVILKHRSKKGGFSKNA